MIDLRPLTARARARLGNPRDFADLATERVELAPATCDEDPPVIQLDDEPERFLTLAEGISAAEFYQRMKGGAIDHPATIGYRFADALIADGTIYADGGYSVIGLGRKRPVLTGAADELADTVLSTNQVCEQYFGHWLTDGLSLELLAGDIGKPSIGIARQPFFHEPSYRAIVGMELQRTAHAHVRNLWVVDDRSMNASRVARFAALRERVRRTVPAGLTGAPCFLLRIGGVARVLANQMELAESLARRGFNIIDPESQSVAALVAALAGASLVVSVEGSALCHGIVAMRPKGTILAIQPPARVNWIQKAACDCARLRFAQAAGDPLGDTFTMPEDRLMRLIDRIDRTVR